MSSFNGSHSDVPPYSKYARSKKQWLVGSTAASWQRETKKGLGHDLPHAAIVDRASKSPDGAAIDNQIDSSRRDLCASCNASAGDAAIETCLNKRAKREVRWGKVDGT